jgi:hypothetical protein
LAVLAAGMLMAAVTVGAGTAVSQVSGEPKGGDDTGDGSFGP